MEIKLTGKRGGIALVSLEDYDELSKYSWSLNNNGYIQGHINDKNVRMHRYIMKAKRDELVDHINSKRYDNRRENLRIFTIDKSVKNGQNKKIKKVSKTSKYRCVRYRKNIKKYSAEITINSKRFYLGSYKNEIDAAKTIDMYIVHNKLDHISLNFPDDKEKYLNTPYVPFVSKRGKNKYIGVHKYNSNYIAYITVNRKRIYIGSFNDEINCAKMRDKYIIENNILGHELNFPNDYPHFNTKVIRTKYKIIDNKTVRLIIGKDVHKNIFIDIEDYDKIKYYSWYIDKAGYICSNDNCTHYKLHRLIMNVTDPNIFVDHIDNDKFNNIKINLRLSNEIKNPQNRQKNKGASSKYHGVSTYGKKWVSYITYKHKKIHIGVDIKEIYAARRRDLYVLDNFPSEHYKFNFEWNDNDILKWKYKLYISTNIRAIIIKNIMHALLDNDLNKVKDLNNQFNNILKNKNPKFNIK